MFMSSSIEPPAKRTKRTSLSPYRQSSITAAAFGLEASRYFPSNIFCSIVSIVSQNALSLVEASIQGLQRNHSAYDVKAR